MQELIRRAKELLADGTVVRVLGWKAGDMPWNPEPAFFENEEELKDFVYDGFCGANLSKMMIEASKAGRKDDGLFKTVRYVQLQPAAQRAPCGPRKSIHHRSRLQGQA